MGLDRAAALSLLVEIGGGIGRSILFPGGPGKMERPFCPPVSNKAGAL